MTDKKKELTDEEKIAKARERRIALAAEKSSKSKEKSDNREDWRRYFLKLNKKLKLNESLEEVMWIHLKTIKHDKKELFDKGVQHFGYKI